MKIDKNKLKIGIWYEDENGKYLVDSKDSIEPVKGAHTYHTCFPLEVTEHIYISHNAEEKARCKHKRKYLKKDKDLIKGYKGRICTSCGCSQTRKWYEPWGRKWDSGASVTPLMDTHVHIGGGNEEIILAMANSGDYTLSEAIAVYAQSCERCSNVLAWKYTNGQDGYPEYSEEWKKANTVCQFCEDENAHT